ncbi:MAG: ArgE/DapE family deacylase [Candidatus Heimdallarchaeota archaeon]|nr:ArgE/DapE family deacylase [Candidatus Heimdallarchaeota archaeon]
MPNEDQEDDISSLFIDLDYLYQLLSDMVKINSIIGSEKELVLFLADVMDSLGFTVHLDEVEKDRPNLYASHTFSPHGKTLTFNGHADTIDVCRGWTVDPFTPLKKEGKLFGLGALDMKAGIACEITAIKALIESTIDLQGVLHFTCIVDEEGYSKGARKMINSSFGKEKTDGIIIAEPFYGEIENNSLPLGATGKVLYKIEVHGKSAHAFRPTTGINAIADAAKIVSTLEESSATNSEDKNVFVFPKKEKFGTGNLCALKITGGYQNYSVMVPDYCEIIINRLIVPGETKQTVVEDLVNFIGKMDVQSEINIQIIPPFYFPYEISEKAPLVNSLINSYSMTFDRKPKMGYLRMITDANVFMGEGKIPTVVFGPKGGNIHSANEYVEIKSLKKVVEVFVQTYINFQQKGKK